MRLLVPVRSNASTIRAAPARHSGIKKLPGGRISNIGLLESNLLQTLLRHSSCRASNGLRIPIDTGIHSAGVDEAAGNHREVTDAGIEIEYALAGTDPGPTKELLGMGVQPRRLTHQTFEFIIRAAEGILITVAACGHFGHNITMTRPRRRPYTLA